MTRVCLWGAWYGSRNAGDQAVLLAITQLLHERLADVRLTVFSGNPSLTESCMVDAGWRVEALHKWRQLPAVIWALARADLFLIGGGVPFYDKAAHVLVFTWLVTLARLFGCPVMVYGAASQQLAHPFSRFVYKHLLNRMDLVTVRDPRTRRELHSLGATQPIVLTADPAMTLKPADALSVSVLLRQEGIEEPPARPLIGITTRRLSATHGYRRDHYRQLSPEAIDRFHDAMAQAADFLTTLGQVCFIPMHTVEPDDDREAAALILQRMRHASQARIFSRQYTPPELMGLIQRCSLLLGSRLHSTIFAAVAAVPFTVVAYDPKLLGIAESFGMTRYAHDLVGLDAEALIATLRQLWADRDGVARHLRQSTQQLCEQAYWNADAASRLCRGEGVVLPLPQMQAAS